MEYRSKVGKIIARVVLGTPLKCNKIAKAKIILLYTICQGRVESQMGLSKSVPRWSILLRVFGGSEGLWGLVRESSWWGWSCLQGFLWSTIQPADLSSNPFDYLKFMTINSSCVEPIGHNLLISVLQRMVFDWIGELTLVSELIWSRHYGPGLHLTLPLCRQ